MNYKYKKEIGSISIISILVILIVILTGILGIEILTSNKENVKKSSYSNNSNSNEINYSKNDNKKDYSKLDAIALLEQGENYNNYSCEYILDEEDGKTTRKFKDNVLVVENGSQKVYQNYTNNKHIVINKDRNIAIVSNLTKGNLIPINKNYCNGLDDLLKSQSITYKYIKEEEYNAIDCIVIEIEGTEENVNSQFSFEEKTNDDIIKINMNIWISKKSGLVAKIDAKYENDANEKFSKVVEYNLVLNNVTNNDIKEPNLTGYKIINA